MSYEDDYKKFRGKCKEMSEALVASDPSLRLVRGHYWCPLWNTEEPHWWAEKEDGTIVDPTAAQFPSGGAGIYKEFDGIVQCAECGEEMHESDVIHHDGNYVFCSGRHHAKFVGLEECYRD